MDLTRGEWVFVGLLAVWATVSGLGEPAAGMAGSYVGAAVIGTLAITGKRRLNDWRSRMAA